MLARLALLFVAVPIAELALLVWLGRHAGLLPTLALILLTGVLGAALARHQGLATLTRFRAAVAAGRPPHREIVHGLLILVAAAFLLTPGLLTDTAGFLLLAPPVRRQVARRLLDGLRRRATGAPAAGAPAAGAPGAGGARGGAAVDVDFRVVDGPTPPERPE